MRKRRKYYGLDGQEEGAATVSRSGYARSRRIKQQSRGVYAAAGTIPTQDLEGHGRQPPDSAASAHIARGPPNGSEVAVLDPVRSLDGQCCKTQ